MINVILPTRVADFDPLRVGASVHTCPGLAISNIRLKRALFNRLLVDRHLDEPRPCEPPILPGELPELPDVPGEFPDLPGAAPE